MTTITRTKIELVVLNVEEGTTHTVTVPEDISRNLFAEIIRICLAGGGKVITGINIEGRD